MIDVLPGQPKADALAAAAASMIILAASSAQAASVKEVFEKYGLLGTFARDCSQPASTSNGYIVYRAIDAGHVQRDTMTGPTQREYIYIADTAAGMGPNEIEVVGTTTAGKPFSYTLRLDGPRHRVMTWTEGGVVSVVDGIWKEKNNYPMPWVTKCE
jgi:opacity protein-like surface antigen